MARKWTLAKQWEGEPQLSDFRVIEEPVTLSSNAKGTQGRHGISNKLPVCIPGHSSVAHLYLYRLEERVDDLVDCSLYG